MGRLIDADVLITKFQSDEEYFEKIGDTAFMFATIGAINDIKKAPTIDAVEVVRCKDCKYWNPWQCSQFNDHTHEVDFCSYGERTDHE